MKLFTLFLLTIPILSGEEGILRGKVMVQETQEPLPGVNVFLDSTYYGCPTNEDGEYCKSSKTLGLSSE
jgi:hypothetical protein